MTPVLDVGKPGGTHAFPLAHLARDIPLQREVIMRDCGAYIGHVGEQPARERRLDDRVMVWHDVAIHHRGGGRQGHLK